MNMIGQAGANLQHQEFSQIDPDLGASAFEQQNEVAVQEDLTPVALEE
jgi:hypothetical protein